MQKANETHAVTSFGENLADQTVELGLPDRRYHLAQKYDAHPQRALTNYLDCQHR